MSEFIVGQPVRVTGDTGCTYHNFPVGLVGDVVGDVDRSAIGDCYRVAGPDGRTAWVHKGDLAPVSSHDFVGPVEMIRTIRDADLPDPIKTSLIAFLVDAL